MTDLFDLALLPAADESERCAAHATRIDLDPGGSALFVDELIVVDMPLPWPKPVWAKDGFTAIPELMMAAGEQGRRVRVLAAVPQDNAGGRIVTHGLRDSADFSRIEHEVAPSEIVDLLTVLVVEGLDASPSTVISNEPQRELLLCTQGSHDMCCGSRGASLMADLHAIDPTLAIRRVSHTGGHRMAPTGVTLPDGRMWGLVTTEEMAGILDYSVTPTSVAARCRGWIGAEVGPAQMAERAVMAAIDDWGFDSRARSVEIVASETDDTPSLNTNVRVSVDGDVWVVEVGPARAVPTIACGAPGGLPAKPGAEWQVHTITRTQ
jgi:hypothetical protein